MRRRAGGRVLSVVLWAAFAAIGVAGAGVLLRACGLLMPLAAATPELAWDFCPAVPASLSAEAERGETLRKLVRQLERDLADKALACASIPPPPPPPFELPTQTGKPRPQQTALLKPPPPPPPPPPRPEPAGPLPADRWAQKDLGMLQGCWVLGHEVGWVSGTLSCTAMAGTLCLNDTGVGRQQMSINCPAPRGSYQCTAPATAQFAGDGTLRVQHPRGECGHGGFWYSASMTCTRTNDTQAACLTTSEGNPTTPTPMEFRRAP